ncbi:MAG: Calx-beta domain-containing protein [Aureliella sp.]
MSARRTSHDKARLQQNRVKAQRIREKAAASHQMAVERHQARRSWWERAFRVPMVGAFAWVKSRCSSLWAAFLAVLGWKAVKPSLASRHGQVKSKARKQAGTRSLLHENLEGRQLLAADILSVDLQAGSDTGVSSTDDITSEQLPTFDVAIDNATAIGEQIQLRLGSKSGTLLGFANTTKLGADTLPVTVTSAIPEGKQTIVAVPSSGVGTEGSLVVDIDITDPTVTINQQAGQADPTNSLPILFDVVFSEPVTGFNGADITLGGTAVLDTPVISVSGSGASYVVSVNATSVTTDGTVTAAVNLGGASDDAGNTNAASTSTDNSVTVDTTAPTVTIDQAAGQADPTNSLPIEFDVVFSEPVTGFTDADVTLGGTAVLDTPTIMVSGSGTTYTVTVDAASVTTDGTVTAAVVASAAVDAAGNSSDASTSTDNSVTLDTTAPTVTINQQAGQADPTNSLPILFDVVFSEPVNNFNGADITLGGTAVLDTPVISVSGTGPAYVVQVNATSVVTDGTVTASVNLGGAWDDAGNISDASTSTDNSVTVDTTAPTVTIDQAAGQADPTNSLPIEFDVVFSEPVTGFTDADVTLGGTAVLDTPTIMVSGSGTTYTVTVDAASVTTDGTVTAAVVASAAVDAAGNSSDASTSTDNSVTLDTTAPTVTLGVPAASASTPIDFTLTGSEPIDPASVVATFLGSSTATFASGPSISVVEVTPSTTLTIRVDGVFSSFGTVDLQITTGDAKDVAGNATTADSNVASTLVSGETVSIVANDTNPNENAIVNSQYTVSRTGTDLSSAVVVTFEIDPSSTADFGGALPDFSFGPQVSGSGPFTVTIPAGSSSTNFDIDLVDDDLFDPDETITLELLSATAAAPLYGVNNPAVELRTMTIVDDEEAAGVTVSVGSSGTAEEGDPDATVDATFTISLTQKLDHLTTVTLDISGTAIEGTDYNFVGGTVVGSQLEVTIPADTLSVDVTVAPIAENALVELTEDVILTPVSIASTDTISVDTAPASVDILDDETATVTIAGATDGKEDTTDGSLTITQSKVASTNTIVGFNKSEDPDLTFGQDYWLTYSVIDSDQNAPAAPNDSKATAQDLDSENWNTANTALPAVTIEGTGDDSYDYYSFTAANGSDIELNSVSSFASRLALWRPNGTLATTSTSGSISTSANASGTWIIGIARSGSGAANSGFTGGGELVDGDTYTLDLEVEGHATPMPTSITIPAGTTTVDITVAIVGDDLLEDDEPLTVTLTSTSGDTDISLGAPGDITDTVNIEDNDSGEVKLIGTGSNFNLNQPGAQNALEPSTDGFFSVAFEGSTLSDEATTVPFEVIGGSAQLGVDYTFGAGVMGSGTTADPWRVIIPANTNSAPINIEVINETDVEEDEFIQLSLLDVPESKGDTLRDLSGPDGDGQITTKSGEDVDTIAIKDEDLAAVTLNSSIDTAVEGGSNGEFTIWLHKATTPGTADLPLVPVIASQETLVEYTLSGSAANVGDISAPTLTGTVTIPAGMMSTTIDVSAILDGLNEPTEEVVMTLNSKITKGDSNIEVDVTRDDDTVFIVDADADLVVKVKASLPNASEPSTDGEFEFFYTGTLSPASAVEVSYTISGSADLGTDYDTGGGKISDKIIIPSGSTSITLPVNVIDDLTVEGTEDVIITINGVKALSPTGGITGDATPATVTIADNDTESKASVTANMDAAEGTVNGEFEISLTAATAAGVLVSYDLSTSGVVGQMADLTGADFTLRDEYGNVLSIPSGTVFIPPNETSVKITLEVVDDAIDEDLSELVTMTLTGYGNPFVSDGSPVSDTLSILPDQVVTVSAGDDAVEGSKVGYFTVNLTRESTVDTVVEYTLSDNEAVPGVDFAGGKVGTVTIPAGDTSAKVFIDPVSVGNDLIPELPESVSIVLNKVTNVGDGSADIEVVNSKTAPSIDVLDDDKAYITIAATDRTEGDAAGSLIFTLTLKDINGVPINAGSDLNVEYSLTGTANGSDYTVSPTTVATIKEGSSTGVITVNVNDDGFIEGTETVTATMDKLTSAFAANTIFLSAVGGPNLVFQEGNSHLGLPAYGGTQDTYIDPDLPFSNLDTDSVRVTSDSPGPGINPRQGLIRFENLFGAGAGRIPTGAEIVDAELTVVGNAFAAGLADLHQVLAPWSESTNWASSGFGDGVVGVQANDSDAESIPSGSLPLAFGATVSTSVLDSLQDWQGAPSSNYGWAVLAASGTLPDTGFADSENPTVADRPSLSVELSTSATANIFDNDGGAIAISSISDGAEEATDGVVTISLPANVPAGESVTVNYVIDDGGSATATEGSDFTGGTGSVTITSGSTATFLVPVLGDNLIEGTESVRVALTGFSASSPAIASALTVDTADEYVDIADDDSAKASVAIGKDGKGVPIDGGELPVGQGASQHIDPVFEVSIDKTSTQPTVIEWKITGSSNFDSNDYSGALSGFATIPAGSQSTTVTLDIVDDTLNEGTESVTFEIVNVTSGAGVSIDGMNSSVSENIEDDDGLTATITASDNLAQENPNSDTAAFTIGIGASDKATRVDFELSGMADLPDSGLPMSGIITGPATLDGPDYTISIPAGVTFDSYSTGWVNFADSTSPQSIVLTITAKQDFNPEGGAGALESVIMEITDTDNANGMPAGVGSKATANIEDEDFSVWIEKTASFATEDGAGDGGLNGQFTVSIANPTPAGDDVKVPFTIPNTGAAGTATYGADYTLTGIGVFVDSVDATEVKGHVFISGGTTTTPITVDVTPDSLVEGPEDIVITIGTPSDVNAVNPATLSTKGSPASATETIADDDSPTVSVVVVDDIDGPGGSDAPGIAEPNNISLAPNNGQFKFELDQAIPSEDVIVEYEIVSTAGDDAEPGDYSLPVSSGTVTISKGTTSATIDIVPTHDLTVENDENLKINIVKATSTSFSINTSLTKGDATAVIQDNDSASVTVAAFDADAREPSNPGIFEFTLVHDDTGLPTDAEAAIDITYSIGGDALPGAAPGLLSPYQPYDYETLSGKVTISAGDSTAQAEVKTFDDNVVEDDETVVLTLDPATSNPSVPASGSDTVTIFADVGAGEDTTVATITKTTDATEGGTNGVFTVTLSKPADEDITIPVTFVSGSATGSDIDSIDSSVTILKGQTTATVDVVAEDDLTIEGTESFSVKLGTPSAAFITPSTTDLVSVAGTPSMDINDNDSNVLTISSPTVVEGDSGTKSLVFTVTSPVGTSSGFTVPVSVTGGTAVGTGGGVGENDYNFSGTTISFSGAAGESKTFAVAVNGDDVVEAHETIELTLGTPSKFASQITSGAVGVGTIQNDDTAVFKINNGSVTEGDSGTVSVPFTISIDGGVQIDEAVDVTIGFDDLTAQGLDLSGFKSVPYGTDYDKEAIVVPFGKGDTSKTFSVPVISDTRVEGGATNTGSMKLGAEQFEVKVTGTSTSKSVNTTDKGTGTIWDDDEALVSVYSSSAKGGDSLASEPGAGQGDGLFIFELDYDVEEDVVVNFTYTIDGNAGDPNGDLSVALPGSVTIPGSTTASSKTTSLAVQVFDDMLLEDNEILDLQITSVTSAEKDVDQSKTDSAEVTILDDDVATVSIFSPTPVTTEDADTSTGSNAIYTLTLSQQSDEPTTVELFVQAGGTTASSGDYDTSTGSLFVTIPAMTSSVDFEIDAVLDATTEGPETLELGLLSNPADSNSFNFSGNPNVTPTADVSSQTDTITILDAGSGIFVSFKTADTIDAEEEGLVVGQFVVQLTDNMGNLVTLPDDVTVIYSVDTGVADSAVFPDDYAGLSNIVVINAGSSTAPIAVSPVDDSDIEGTEFVDVTITGASTSMMSVALGDTATPTALPINEQVEILDNDVLPPQVESIVINNGDVQRSKLKTVEVTFDSAVDIAAGAFTVEKRADTSPTDPPEGTVGGVIVSTAVVGGKTVATLTFTPNATYVDGVGSLVDGNYQITIDPTKVTTLGTPLIGAGSDPTGGDLVFGDEAVDGFYRLFGDANGMLMDGSSAVDALDFIAAQNAFLNLLPVDAFDELDDGVVDALDFIEVQARFLNALGRDLGGF